MKKKCSKCGGDTNSKTGLCASCTVDERLDAAAKQKTEEAKKLRACSIEGCGKYTQTHGLCRRHYREKYGKSYKPKKKRGGIAELKKDDDVSREIDEIPVKARGKVEAESIKPNPLKYPGMIFTIDLTEYPEIYERLLYQAKKEFRIPAMEVISILHDYLRYLSDLSSPVKREAV